MIIESIPYGTCILNVKFCVTAEAVPVLWNTRSLTIRSTKSYIQLINQIFERETILKGFVATIS